MTDFLYNRGIVINRRGGIRILIASMIESTIDIDLGYEEYLAIIEINSNIRPITFTAIIIKQTEGYQIDRKIETGKEKNIEKSNPVLIFRHKNCDGLSLKIIT